MIVAGIGCRRGCAADEIVALVEAAQRTANCSVGILAAPDFKRDEPGLHEAARRLDVALLFVAADRLGEMQPLCPTRSAAASRAHGVGSVAEGAALAASGGRLLLARITGGRATCALASS